MVVPEEVVLLLTGVPATGKSTFGKYLCQEAGFAHYDLECYPDGWAHVEPRPFWQQRDLPGFMAQVTSLDARIALDWGFPPACRPMVDHLRALGATLVWFDGDRRRARELYVERGKYDVGLFDGQVARIDAAGLPHSLACPVITTLGATGVPADPRDIAEAVFT